MGRMGSSRVGWRVRRQFSEEFKNGAVRLVFAEAKTVGAVARELDLTPSALGGWVRQVRADRTKGKSGLMKEKPEELTRLRKEVRELRLERDLPQKCRPSSPQTSGSLCGDRGGEGPRARAEAVSVVRRLAERILRVADATGVASRPTWSTTSKCSLTSGVDTRPQVG